jgi:hypothetical protein
MTKVPGGGCVWFTLLLSSLQDLCLAYERHPDDSFRQNPIAEIDHI